MKILVFGAGAIGSLFAGLLVKADFNTVLVGRSEHVAAINAYGLRMEGVIQDTLKIPAYTNLEQVKDIDLIILATKAYDTQKAMEQIAPILKPETRILSIQNGLGNEEIIAQYSKHVVGGVTSNGVTYTKVGHIVYHAAGLTTIGNYNAVNDEFVFKIQKVFKKAGLKTKVSDQIKEDIFQKLIINVGINALATIAGVKNGEVIKQTKLKTMFIKLIDEAVNVGKAKGLKVPDDMLEQAIAVVENTAKNTNSMLQDMRKGKQTEIDFLNGKIVELGKEVGVVTPLNLRMTQMIKDCSR
ncbi:2-dehydropantoate 2-reductase [bacterium]|nr:2-dehydropantoate 2-reductase [bacterium]